MQFYVGHEAEATADAAFTAVGANAGASSTESVDTNRRKSMAEEGLEPSRPVRDPGF